MWKNDWSIPPQNADELYMWKVYCRIHNDVGLPTPGSWIHKWMLKNVFKNINENNSYPVTEAVRWYTLECRE